MIRALFAALALWLAGIAPAQAAVTITFWSHELGSSFPHAFISLRGTPERGGAPVDGNYGFTAKSVTPAILIGPVGGEMYAAKPGYVASSDAQFSLVLTDAQYDAVLTLIRQWGAKGVKYSLGKRNCVHFAQAAAVWVGLTGTDQPKLMKKPRSYLLAVAAANQGRVTVIAQKGRDYLASLPPGDGTPPIDVKTLDETGRDVK